MQINQQSRLFYDTDQTSYQQTNSERTVRWYTDNLSENKTLQYGNTLKRIDDDISLRSQPTRLNEIYDINTEIFGTAPFKGRNDGPVDVESELLHRIDTHTDFKKQAVIEDPVFSTYNNSNDLFYKGTDTYKTIPGVISELTSASTRNEYRNTRIN